MNILNVFLTSVFSVSLLFVLAKLMGYRQISQMCVFDYINGITIGSIAADLAMSGGEKTIETALALIIFAAFTVGISFLTDSSVTARKFITGRPAVLYSGGEVYEKNFKKAKLDINEFLMLCRSAGWFDLSQIDTVLIEPNGKLSILPLPSSRPLTPADMNITPNDDIIPVNVIISGKVIEKNLKNAGYDTDWLFENLRLQGYKTLENVVLATVKNGKLSIYKNAVKIV